MPSHCRLLPTALPRIEYATERVRLVKCLRLPRKVSACRGAGQAGRRNGRFYRVTEVDPLELRISQIKASLFSDPPSAYAVLAWEDGRLVGLAAYSFLWPAGGLTRSLYLKELYVAETARQKGVGRL